MQTGILWGVVNWSLGFNKKEFPSLYLLKTREEETCATHSKIKTHQSFGLQEYEKYYFFETGSFLWAS